MGKNKNKNKPNNGNNGVQATPAPAVSTVTTLTIVVDSEVEKEKLEEYLEIKDYYRSRFFDGWDKVKAGGLYWYNEQFEQHPQFKNFDFLILRNGYQSNSPKLTLRNPKIKIGKGRPEWGAEPEKLYFVITWEV